MLESVGEEIWTAAAPLALAGAEFGTRMTVVRLADGGVMLISPIELDDALATEIDAIGPVRAVVAPNAFHHFYFAAVAKRYPEAACFLAAGTEEKLGDDAPTFATLGDEPEPLWKDVLDQLQVEGVPMTNEVVFLHRATKTLVLTDLCFHFDPPPGGWTGLFLRLAGARGGVKVSRLMRFSMKDEDAVRGSIARILEWDFDNLVVTHGANLIGGAKEAFRAATADV